MNSTACIATLFNTTGAATGPLLATFVLPTRSLGFQKTLVACAIGLPPAGRGRKPTSRGLVCKTARGLVVPDACAWLF